MTAASVAKAENEGERVGGNLFITGVEGMHGEASFRQTAGDSARVHQRGLFDPF